MSTDERERMQAYLEAEIARLSAVLRLTPWETPGFVRLEGVSPSMSVGPDGELYQRAFERGELLFERTTRDPDELLYWAFEAVTGYLAHLWVRDHPEADRGRTNPRWERQVSLLHALNPRWAERWCAELRQGRDDCPLVPALPPPPPVFDRPEPAAARPPRRPWWRHR
jgi:hypothetical protein